MPAANTSSSHPSTFSHPLSLLIWLVLQLLVLLLPVLQVPLSDEFPRPVEKLAIEELVVAQIAIGSLLFPLLIRGFSAALVIMATTWPFLLLAGLLSSTPPHHLLEVGGFVSIWLIALGLLHIEMPRWNAWTGAIVSTFAIGGAIAAYLRAEFANGESDGLLFGPIVGALHIVHGGENRWRAWVVLPVLLMLGGVLQWFAHRLRTRSQQVIHNFGG